MSKNSEKRRFDDDFSLKGKKWVNPGKCHCQQFISPSLTLFSVTIPGSGHSGQPHYNSYNSSGEMQHPLTHTHTRTRTHTHLLTHSHTHTRTHTHTMFKSQTFMVRFKIWHYCSVVKGSSFTMIEIYICS